MDNNELLQAIGQLIDTKLEPIISGVNDLKKEMEVVKTEIEVVKTEIEVVKTQLVDIKEEMHEIRGAQNYVIDWVDKIDATVKDISLGLPR